MWPNPEETADLVKFPEEILNGFNFIFCSVVCSLMRLLSSFKLQNSSMEISFTFTSESPMKIELSYSHYCILLKCGSEIQDDVKFDFW